MSRGTSTHILTHTHTDVAQLLYISVFHTTHEKDQGQQMSGDDAEEGVRGGAREGGGNDIGRQQAVSTD